MTVGLMQCPWCGEEQFLDGTEIAWVCDVCGRQIEIDAVQSVLMTADRIEPRPTRRCPERRAELDPRCGPPGAAFTEVCTSVGCGWEAELEHRAEDSLVLPVEMGSREWAAIRRGGPLQVETTGMGDGGFRDLRIASEVHRSTREAIAEWGRSPLHVHTRTGLEAMLRERFSGRRLTPELRVEIGEALERWLPAGLGPLPLVVRVEAVPNDVVFIYRPGEGVEIREVEPLPLLPQFDERGVQQLGAIYGMERGSDETDAEFRGRFLARMRDPTGSASARARGESFDEQIAGMRSFVDMGRERSDETIIQPLVLHQAEVGEDGGFLIPDALREGVLRMLSSPIQEAPRLIRSGDGRIDRSMEPPRRQVGDLFESEYEHGVRNLAQTDLELGRSMENLVQSAVELSTDLADTHIGGEHDEATSEYLIEERTERGAESFDDFMKRSQELLDECLGGDDDDEG